MNKYLTELYNWLDANHSYSSRYTPEEFQSNMQNEQFLKEMYSWLSSVDNTFTEREPIEQWFEKVKKKDEFGPTFQEVVTESITETEESPGSLDSSVEEKTQTPNQEDTDVPEDVEYLQDDLNSLMQLETTTESSLNPVASARARMMREQSREVDPVLK